MTRIFTLLITILFGFITCTLAQIDQIAVGASYANQAYYNLSTGEVTQVANDAWDIAFSNNGIQDAGIFINESSALSSSPLQLFLSSETDWSQPITDLSPFVESEIIYNPELNWTEGAFNTVKAPGSPLDYGWGAYNPMSHIIEGDKIFVIQMRDGSFIKFQVEQLSGGVYSFRYANLDGSNENSASVSKNDSEDTLIYFSFSTGDVVDMPTDYDLVFQRYATPLDDGSGNLVDYPVTGVLLAPRTEAVVAYDVDPTSVEESDYSGQYSSEVNVIGHDWKSFDFSTGWNIDENRAQFVRASNGEIYKVVFFDFEGSSTGITTLERTLLGTVSSNEEEELDHANFSIYPNPTSDYINIHGLRTSVEVKLYDGLGRLVLNQKVVDAQDQIDLRNLVQGQYLMLIDQNGQLENHKISIIK